jgi:heat shock protein HtpX
MLHPTVNFGRDNQLRTRMWITMLILGALYGFFVWVVLLTAPVLLVLVVGFALFQFAASDKMILASMRAKVVTPEEAPKLHQMVDRLSADAGIPKPKVAIADMAVPNAFATGRSQKHAAVAVTSGLIAMLSDDELEGVLAHEISHIRTKDVVVMTYASFFLVVAAMLSTWLMFSAIFGGMSRGGRNGNAHSAIMIALIVTLIVRFVGGVLVSALSRYREFSADRGAALLTHKPMALASALERISGSFTKLPKDDLRKAETMNAFFIMPAVGDGMASLFSTHPSMNRRIERLREMESDIARMQ